MVQSLFHLKSTQGENRMPLRSCFLQLLQPAKNSGVSLSAYRVQPGTNTFITVFSLPC